MGFCPEFLNIAGTTQIHKCQKQISILQISIDVYSPEGLKTEGISLYIPYICTAAWIFYFKWMENKSELDSFIQKMLFLFVQHQI